MAGSEQVQNFVIDVTDDGPGRGDVQGGVTSYQQLIDAIRRSGGTVRDAREPPPPPPPPPEEDASRLCATVQRLCQAVNAIGARLERLEANGGDLVAMQQQLQVIGARLVRVEEAGGASQAHHGDVCAILERLVGRLDSLDSSISAAVSLRDGLAGRLAAVEGWIRRTQRGGARAGNVDYECVDEVVAETPRRCGPCRCRRCGADDD